MKSLVNKVIGKQLAQIKEKGLESKTERNLKIGSVCLKSIAWTMGYVIAPLLIKDHPYLAGGIHSAGYIPGKTADCFLIMLATNQVYKKSKKSYVNKKSPQPDLNRRPTDYKSVALPLSYGGIVDN